MSHEVFLLLRRDPGVVLGSLVDGQDPRNTPHNAGATKHIEHRRPAPEEGLGAQPPAGRQRKHNTHLTAWEVKQEVSLRVFKSS